MDCTSPSPPKIDFYTAAMQYHATGLCVLPMRTDKSPGLATFKAFHTKRPTAEQLRRWFVERKGIIGNLAGLGIMCGKVSSGVFVRDFDQAAAYGAWRRANPVLAESLPTVGTSRGYHVWARWHEKLKTLELGDGELRAERAFVVAPPSRHPSGTLYEWVVPLVAGKLPPLISPHDAGLDRSVTERTENTEGTELIEGTEGTESTDAIASLRSVPSVLSVTTVDEAIRLTIPTQIGQRHRLVFKLVRALKAVESAAGLPLAELKPVAKRWHAQALPFIGTQCFDETWSDFVNAWQNVKYALGESMMDQIVERLETMPPPPETAEYDSPDVKRLIALCAELQRQAGKQPFFLDARTAAKLLGMSDAMAPWRLLKMLKADGLLAEVETGKPGRATRWRWRGGR